MERAGYKRPGQDAGELGPAKRFRQTIPVVDADDDGLTEPISYTDFDTAGYSFEDFNFAEYDIFDDYSLAPVQSAESSAWVQSSRIASEDGGELPVTLDHCPDVSVERDYTCSGSEARIDHADTTCFGTVSMHSRLCVSSMLHALNPQHSWSM